MIELRPYQSAAIEAIYGYFGEKSGNPLIVLPTAAASDTASLSRLLRRPAE